MMVHVQFGPTGRAGRIVLLNVTVALEQENEDASMEQQEKLMVVLDLPPMKSSVI